jgi:imidazoleglycerol-phosphate dehydratase
VLEASSAKPTVPGGQTATPPGLARPATLTPMGEQTAAGVRINVYGRGEATVETGLPVLNRLLDRLAEVARFDLVLDIEPGDTQAEVEAAAEARGHGAGALTSAEALAHVVLETSDEPLLVTNVDLTQARIGGLGTDVTRRFLEVLAENAGLVLHVRLLNGTDSSHVLEAIFKALGAALGQACERPRRRS